MSQLQPHIGLDRTMTQAKYALLPGDHKRLDCVLPFLDEVEQLAFNREFRSMRGFYKGVEVLVISTGIGGPSMAITLHELNEIGIKSVIRIGSCGALQSELDLGQLIIACGAVRDEGTSASYIGKQFPAVAHPELLYTMQRTNEKQKFSAKVGIVRSHDSFYTRKENEICDYWSEHGVLGADMESATLFVVSHLLGLRAASILNVVVKYRGSVEEGIGSYLDQQSNCMQGEQDEIRLALETIIADCQNSKR